MTVYEAAERIAGLMQLVLFTNDTIKEGAIVVVPNGEDPGVFINPADRPA